MSYIKPIGNSVQINFLGTGYTQSPPREIFVNFSPHVSDTWVCCDLKLTPYIYNIDYGLPILETSLNLDSSMIVKNGYIAVCPIVVIPVTPTVTTVSCYKHVVIDETEIFILRDCPYDPELRVTPTIPIPTQSINPNDIVLVLSCSLVARWDIYYPTAESEIIFESSCSDVYITTNSYIQEGYVIALDPSQAKDYGNDQFGRGVALSGDGLVLAGGAPYWEFSGLFTSEGKIFIYNRDDGIWRYSRSIEGASYDEDGGYHYIGTSVSLSYDGRSMAFASYNKNWFYIITPYRSQRYNKGYFSFNPTSIALNGEGSMVAIGDYVVGNVYFYTWIQTSTVLNQCYNTISKPFSNVTSFGRQLAWNRSGNILMVSSSIGILTYDLILGEWVRRDCIIKGDSATSISMALDGNMVILSGVLIYDWQETSWIQRGAILTDTIDYGQPSYGVGITEDGKYIATGYPLFDSPYIDTGLISFWKDSNDTVTIPRIKITVVVDEPQIVGSAFVECDVTNIYIFTSCDSFSYNCTIPIPEVLISTNHSYLITDVSTVRHTLRNTLNGYVKSVALSGSGRVLSIASDSVITIYDWINPNWIERGTLSITNTCVSLNFEGTTMVVGEPDRDVVTTYYYNGTSWFLLHTLNGSVGSRFGYSVSFKGITLAVSSIDFNNKGKVEIYVWTMGSWVLRDTLLGIIDNARYGISVALAVNVLCIASKSNELYGEPAKIHTYDYIENEWIKRGDDFTINENSVLWRTNQYRQKFNKNLLRSNACLMKAAYLHSKDMAENDYFSHFSLDGRNPFTRIDNADMFDNIALNTYHTYGENIAKIGNSTASAESVVLTWESSTAGHAETMRSADMQFNELSVGIWKGVDFTFYTQNFGLREDGIGLYFNSEQDYNHIVSISLSDDGSKLVVGSTEWDEHYSHTGGVQVFLRFDDTWLDTVSNEIDWDNHQWYYDYNIIHEWIAKNKSLISPNEQMDGFFGGAVSLNANGRLLAIGASGENKSYIYSATPKLYKVAGIIKQGNDGIAAVTRVIQTNNGKLQATKSSNPDGIFEINEMSYGGTVDVIFNNPLLGTKDDAIECVTPIEYFED